VKDTTKHPLKKVAERNGLRARKEAESLASLAKRP